MKKRIFKLIAWVLILINCISCETVMADPIEKVVRVGIYELEGFHSFDEYGNPQGYCIDYLNVVAAATGWKYEYVPLDDFLDGCSRLENQEIDLLAPVMMTEARRAKYSFSEMDLGTEYTVLVTTQDKEDLYYEDYTAFEGLKIAVVHDYPLTEYFIAYMNMHGFTSELVYFSSLEESKAALESGQVDAMVDSIVDMEKEYKLLARFAPQPFYFITYKGNVGFLNELNMAMNRIQNTYPTLLDELLVTYYPIYELQFYTREEMEYIQGHDVLKVAYVTDRQPLSFTDENGEFNGISRAIFDRISQACGLQFEYVALPSGEITYDYLVGQGIDVLTGVEYNSANMNSNGIFLSRPYMEARKVMVSRPEFVYEKGGTYKLGIIAGSQTLRKVLNKQYPDLEIVDYETMDECFRALHKGEIDILLQNQYVVEAILTKPIYSAFSVVPIEGLADELCFSTVLARNGGAGMDEAESSLLIGILNKAISQISDVEVDDMVMRETMEHQYEIEIYDFLYNYRFTIAAVLFALVILQTLIIVYYRERHKREKLIQEETKRNALQQKRYQTIVECSDDLIYEISLDGDSNLSSEKIKEKFGWEIGCASMENLDFQKAMEILHIHPDDEPIFRQSQLSNGEGKFDDLTVRICKADGSYIWCRLSRVLLFDDDMNVVSILGKIVDIDQEVKEKKTLEHRSRTDLLTGLLNKNTFEKEVREYVEKNSTENACFVFIDMDHFKEINDKFGHSVGDQVIKENARKIQLLFANFDLVGRFGGDEFCIFVKDIPRETLIDRLKFAVKKMEQEYSFQGGVVKLSASIGAAYCKKSGVGYKELLDVADVAAYRAKDNGRNCYIIEDIE